MLKEFIKKMSEWVLEKEEEAAKECKIKVEDIDKQIEIITQKRDELKKRCEEQINELEDFIKRLEKIKNIEVLKCQNKG
jgi:peptidoglycan hydrolase CwlO-like protein